MIIMSEKDQLLKELTFAYIHSSGPGGQNVNKVATAVQLRFDIKKNRNFRRGNQSQIVENCRQTGNR